MCNLYNVFIVHCRNVKVSPLKKGVYFLNLSKILNSYR